MKFVLLLFLLSAISCKNFFNCLIENQQLWDIAKDVMKPIREKDFASLLPLALEKLPEVARIVGKCLRPETDEPLLQATTTTTTTKPKRCRRCRLVTVNKVRKTVCFWTTC